MKRFFMMLLCCMVLGGCGEKEKSGVKEEEPVKQETEAVGEADSIDGFERAVYGKFNSPSEENGLGGTLVYVEGVIDGKLDIEDALVISLIQDDGNGWLISFSDRPNRDSGLIFGSVGKKVRIFGKYEGYSENYKTPVISAFVDGGKVEERNKDGSSETVWSAKMYLNKDNEVESKTSSPAQGAKEQVEQNKETPDLSPDITMGKQNALKSAMQYLNYSPFSHDGLVEQLGYEGYTSEEAVYAADNCGADWNEQALKSANSYLSYSAFSRQGLIDQLMYEGFTNEQATYGADNCGADWNEQAAKSAGQYLDYSAFSREGLIDQLQYEGFTAEQATYGAEANGY